MPCNCPVSIKVFSFSSNVKLETNAAARSSMLNDVLQNASLKDELFDAQVLPAAAGGDGDGEGDGVEVLASKHSLVSGLVMAPPAWGRDPQNGRRVSNRRSRCVGSEGSFPS